MKNRIRSVAFAVPFALVACVGGLVENDRPCPCASGWTCCATANVCVKEGASCPGAMASDSGPADDSGATSDSGYLGDVVVGNSTLPSAAAARWIAFDSDLGGYNRDIYLIRADGTGLRQLTTDASTEKDPAFSHDGRYLAFASDRTGAMQIYVMNLTTGQVTQVTSATGEADYGPDGGYPGVPVNTGDGGITAIYPDGGGVLLAVPGGADEPSWSQDDQQIVFHDGASVYIMGSNGTNPRIVGTGLDTFNAYEYPSLSSDGTEVLVDRNNEIDALKTDGGGVRSVVQNWTTTEEAPALSPDGVNVAFGVFCYSTEQIAVTPFAGYAPDPCKTRMVTPTSIASARRPAWGPANVIAFESVVQETDDAAIGTATGNASIALSVSPGTQPFVLVGGLGDSRNPNWAPAGFEPK